ncbi:type I glyceraldehyde-3-phosphate dehydrogenase [Candidatus Parcubacteria bacterium]|nr:type I glyceraldehyde-3-phosphate dehydrogenase [Candidatus Parcubacteria bacterium]
MTKVAINGLGRIGRAFLRLAMEREGLEIVAVNDLGDIDNLAYLLKYDTAYGKSALKVEAKKDGKEPYLSINGRRVRVLSEKEPKQLPWKDLGIDVVVESTGFFESYEGARGHIEAGAKRVVISAPAKGDGEGVTVLMGINEDALQKFPISSNASCTTNAGSPIMAILDEELGIEKAILSTVHAYTATQKLVDSPDKGDLRRGRAGAQNIVPSTTGAAIAVTKALPSLAGKFDGIALRVPVVAGSIADVTFISKKTTSVEEVNAILEKAAGEERWQGIFSVTREPLVSSDIVGNTHGGIADLAFTKVVGGNLVKVLVWYDNEMGYAMTLLRHVQKAGEFI